MKTKMLLFALLLVLCSCENEIDFQITQQERLSSYTFCTTTTKSVSPSNGKIYFLGKRYFSVINITEHQADSIVEINTKKTIVVVNDTVYSTLSKCLINKQ